MTTCEYTDGNTCKRIRRGTSKILLGKPTTFAARRQASDSGPLGREIGCGAGEILVQLQTKLPHDSELHGYDISPQSHEMALARSNDRLEFHLADITEERGLHFDLIVIADLIEHLDDYYGFLRKVKPLADHVILHIPLDLSAYSVIRSHYLADQRRTVGHIHFFTKDLALAGLTDAGFEVLDCFYPTPPADKEVRPLKQHVLRWMRDLSYAVAPDFSVKTLGGRSLMVLAR